VTLLKTKPILITNYTHNPNILDKVYPLHMITAGAEHQHLVNRPGGIPHHQIVFTASGSGRIILNDKKIDIAENSFCYLKPFTPQYYFPINNNWDTYWITYSQNRNFNMLSLDNGVYKTASNEPYINIIRQILNLFSDPDNNVFTTPHSNIIRDLYENPTIPDFQKNSSILLYSLLLEINDHLGDINYIENRFKLQVAMDYINNNFTEQIEIPYLASLSGISTEYFCRIFKKNYHMSPIEYITTLRLKEASQKLLNEKSMSIAQVGESVGYNSPSYFIKLFKKNMNLTPSEFRNLYNR